MGDLKLRPNRALKYFLKNQRCSEEIKSGHLLFKWVKRMKDYLQIQKSSLMKCFLPMNPMFVLICHLSLVSTDFVVIRDHLHRVFSLSIP